MNDFFPERDLLRSIDPAPRDLPEDAQGHNLRTVLARVASAPKRRRTARRTSRQWLRVALPVTGLVAAAAIVLPLALPDSAHDPSPSSATDTAQPGILRVGYITNNGTRILARTTVGASVFLLGQRGDDIRFGASFDGSDPDDNWEAMYSRPSLEPHEITLDGPATYPNAGQDGISTATGQVGADVTGIDVHTRSGRTIHAAVSSGYWIAAWDGQDFSAPNPKVAFTVHLRNGSTETITYNDLLG